MCVITCVYIYIHTLSIYPHNINIQKLGIAGMTMSGVKVFKAIYNVAGITEFSRPGQSPSKMHGLHLMRMGET